ncbi:MAG: hypothetical protein RBS68_02345 [Anaerolineales bacterium]|nr:hypothetical protein [Anaerolineales bacterium]
MDETLPLGLLLILMPLFFVAGAYASVGMGGGTGYLAVMTLVGVSAVTMTPIVLLLNLVVTGAVLLRFGLAGRLNWRLFLPFLLPGYPGHLLGWTDHCQPANLSGAPGNCADSSGADYAVLCA